MSPKIALLLGRRRSYKKRGEEKDEITLHRDAVETKRRGENKDEKNRDDDDEEEEKIARPDAAVCPAVGRFVDVVRAI